MVDPMRRKQLARGTEQLAQEGTVQLYQPPLVRTGDLILGAVGLLQLEVVKYRLESEYNVKARLEPVPFRLARWVSRLDGAPVDLTALREAVNGMVVVDVKARPVVLFEGEWNLHAAQKFNPELRFAETAQGVVVRDA
jgi:peptide chain release factor 3